MRERDEWIEAGAIVKPHGVKGDLIVDVASDLAKCFIEGLRIRLTTRRGEESFGVVERATEHAGRLVVRFEGVSTRESAEALRSCSVWLTRGQVGPLAEGRYFVQDIIGLEVRTEDDENLGTVEDVLSMPANDVFVVRGRGEEILLPVIEDVILGVDVDAGRIVVRLIEGLRRGDR
jgi:16S rRNA processing protein RimM